MDPDPLPPIGAGLQGKGVVDLAGVRVIKAVGTQAAEIEAIRIARPGLVSAGHQPLRLRQQLFAEALLPDAAAQGRQGMKLPEAQIHQQMADRTSLRRALGLLQAAAQLKGDGRVAGAASHRQQELQLLPLERGQGLRVQGLARPQQGKPGLAPLIGEAGLPPLPPQLAQVPQGAGLHLAVAPAEKYLFGLLQLQPAGRPGRWGVGVGDQGHELLEVAGGFADQQPGGTEIPDRGALGEQLSLHQPPGVSPRRLAGASDPRDRAIRSSWRRGSCWARPSQPTRRAALEPLRLSTKASSGPLGPISPTRSPGWRDKAELSLPDSRRAATPGCGPASPNW